jgi:hypothetical protein
LLKLCLFLLVRRTDLQKRCSADESQRLAAANNILHCFGLLPAESAGWIPVKQAHSIQVPSNRGNCQSQEMPTQFEQVVSSFLTSFAYKELTMSVTWQIYPGTLS